MPWFEVHRRLIRLVWGRHHPVFRAIRSVLMNEHTANPSLHAGMLSSLALKFVLGGLAFVATVAGSANGQDNSANTVSQPYLVFVSDEGAHLRCGPSGEYYKTEAVRHGQELEVYVETGDGWLGVRPVEQSFCWVAADAVELSQQAQPKRQSGGDVLGSATVTEDKTVAWIGTNLGRARRYRWQVQLAKGEEVTIVGSSEREGPDGPQTWYRVVPPSGEFRWIHRDQTAATAEALVASLKRPEPAQHMFLPDGNTEPTPAAKQPRVAMSQFEADVANEDWDLDTDTHLSETDTERSHPRRELAERVARLSRSEEQAHPGAEIEEKEDHHPRSLSDRIARGLESLVGGGLKEAADLEPITRSSRRIPDLVPIEDHRVARTETITNDVATVAHEEAMPATPRAAVPAAAPVVGSGVLPIGSSVASTTASPTTVPTSQAPQDSTMTITSRPRMVDGNGSVATMGGSINPSQPSGIQQVSAVFPPATPKLRTIAAAQMEQVQRDVAQSDVATLPVLFSKLMARGASAPEIGLVAEAAERLQLHALATRCREYQVVAQRRDGETVVQTLGLPTPITPVPTIHSSVAPISSVVTTGSQINYGSQSSSMNQAPANLPVQNTATVAHEVPAPAALPVHEGTLVEVYSADPTRPPYAITDRGGRTLAYITPAPGVDVHSHLGATIRVTGESGYLKGIDTPHVMATSAARIVR
jgi:SH3-like domain-containing protein